VGKANFDYVPREGTRPLVSQHHAV
jgi:hypothetical protein